MLSGCKSEASPETVEPTSATQPEVVTPSAAKPGTATAPAQAPALNANCPAGRWSYDYSDQALEAMMKNVAGATVLKKEGLFICNVSEGTEGTVVCETQGKPVVNVVETSQAGMKMTINISIDGKAVTQFKIVDGQQMRIVSSDTSGLKIDTQVSVGGRQVPFPADKLISIFGKPESMMSYRCEEGNLLLKPQIENTETVWQELKPVR